MIVVSSKDWERKLVQRFYEEIVYRKGADRNGREERGTVTQSSQREEHREHRGKRREKEETEEKRKEKEKRD
jgi:hypothetical protein